LESHSDLQKELTQIRKQALQTFMVAEIIPLGNTNAGKSTLLAKLTGLQGLFNTSTQRETACIWRYSTFSESETAAASTNSYKIKEIYNQQYRPEKQTS
jgi:GTP-binding protein EngB required for normal cell division